MSFARCEPKNEKKLSRPGLRPHLKHIFLLGHHIIIISAIFSARCLTLYFCLLFLHFLFSCTSSAISSLAWFSPDRVSNPLSSKSKGVGNLARFPLVSSFFIGCHHCCWYSTWGCRRDSLCFRNHTEKKNSYLWTFLKVSSKVWKIKKNHSTVICLNFEIKRISSDSHIHYHWRFRFRKKLRLTIKTPNLYRIHGWAIF